MRTLGRIWYICVVMAVIGMAMGVVLAFGGIDNPSPVTTAEITAAGGMTTVSGSIGFSVDGSGSAIVPTTNRTVLAYAQDIVEWYIVGNVSGTAIVDVRTNGTSLVGAGNKPSLASSAYSNAAVSGWTATNLPKGTILQFVVVTNATCTQLNVVLGTTHR